MAPMLRLTRILSLGAVAATTVVVLAAQRPAAKPAAAGEWRYYGGDAGQHEVFAARSDHAAPTSSSLQVAWRWSSPDNEIVKTNPAARPGAYQDTPIMVNGVLYTTTSLGIYVAIDPATGRTLWQYDPEIWKVGRPPNLGFTHRGMAYWTDGTRKRIISGTHDAHLVSIDAETGKPDPAFGANGRVDVIEGLPYAERVRNYAINSTPVVVQERHHRRIEHHRRAAGEGAAARRHLRLRREDREEAVDVPLGSADGRVRPRDLGRRVGGVHGQHQRLVDDHRRRGARLRLPAVRHADQRLLRRPSARQQPVCREPRLSRRQRPASASGISRRVHHGLWDYDFPAAPILVDITVNGRRINAVAQVSKQGFVYVFDRKTGEPVWPIEERPVPQSSAPGERTAKTQPFPTKPPALRSSGHARTRMCRFHAGAAGAGARSAEAVGSRPAVHAAVRARHDADAG